MEREEKIKAIMNRDSSYDGKFCYGVKSTGIVCKPSCKAKNPLESNIVLFDTIEQATNAGYRPCKVCMNSSNIIQIQRYHSPCGDLILGSFDDKLCLCDWAVERHRDVVDIRLRKVLRAGYEEKTSNIIQETSKQLDEYFDGKRTVFDIPMLFAGRDFQKKVWHKLLEIPYGVLYHTENWRHNWVCLKLSEPWLMQTEPMPFLSLYLATALLAATIHLPATAVGSLRKRSYLN